MAGESSSEYESGYDKEEEPTVEGPICLKAKVSHTLAYVPSVYDRLACVLLVEPIAVYPVVVVILEQCVDIL